MCGIVGYIGHKSVASVLLVGLKKLEYRGYDSAGWAALDKDEVIIKKSKGKISFLEDLTKSQNNSGNLGIGHTRWATHGEPSVINAHPHKNHDNSIAVVHNGIIENFLEIKKELKNKGYTFVSETDTEVIPHLIDYFLKKGLGVEAAFWETLQKLEGKYAIAMICRQEKEKIFFVKNGAPLILAYDSSQSKDKREMFLASDIPAVLPIAKETYYLHDKEWGFMTSNELQLMNWKKEKIKPSFKKTQVCIEDVDKKEYSHFMLKEIYEQPNLIQKIIESRINSKNEITFSEMDLSHKYISGVGRIIIQACGTSLNAGLIGKLYLEQYSNVYTDADFSSEFRYRNPVLCGDTLIIGISQSGETADTLAGLHEAKAKFLKVLSFLNNSNSTISRESDAVIHLMAGPEIGVASTKAYTAEILNLLFFSLYLGSIKQLLPDEKKKKNNSRGLCYSGENESDFE